MAAKSPGKPDIPSAEINPEMAARIGNEAANQCHTHADELRSDISNLAMGVLVDDEGRYEDVEGARWMTVDAFWDGLLQRDTQGPDGQDITRMTGFKRYLKIIGLEFRHAISRKGNIGTRIYREATLKTTLKDMVAMKTNTIKNGGIFKDPEHGNCTDLENLARILGVGEKSLRSALIKKYGSLDKVPHNPHGITSGGRVRRVYQIKAAEAATQTMRERKLVDGRVKIGRKTYIKASKFKEVYGLPQGEKSILQTLQRRGPKKVKKAYDPSTNSWTRVLDEKFGVMVYRSQINANIVTAPNGEYRHAVCGRHVLVDVFFQENPEPGINNRLFEKYLSMHLDRLGMTSFSARVPGSPRVGIVYSYMGLRRAVTKFKAWKVRNAGRLHQEMYGQEEAA